MPPPALQEYVLSISTVQAVLPYGVDEATTPYPPTPFQSLLFYCEHPVSMGRTVDGQYEEQPLAVLLGPQVSRVNIKVTQRIKAIRVDFLPGGLYRLLGIPMNQLFDLAFDASVFFGAEIKPLIDELANLSGLEAGKNKVEAFLLSILKKSRDLLPLDAALFRLVKNDGAISVEQTASLACLSIRQFERKCQERIGMSPKLYARILRFSKAYRLHEARPDLSWTKIAHEAAYYDQMHLIRDFKVFAGVNPSVIERQLQATPLKMQKDLRY